MPNMRHLLFAPGGEQSKYRHVQIFTRRPTRRDATRRGLARRVYDRASRLHTHDLAAGTTVTRLFRLALGDCFGC